MAAAAARRRLRLGVVQAPAITGPSAVTSNMAAADELVRAAARDGAQLVLLPEAFPAGYSYEYARVWPHVDWLEGAGCRRPDPQLAPAAAVLAAIAGRHGVYVATTLLEAVRGGDVFNTFVLAQPDGSLHPGRHSMGAPAGPENFIFAPGGVRVGRDPGHAGRVIDTPLGRLGVSICFETYLRSTWDELAAGAPDFVLAPHCGMTPPVSWLMPRAEAARWHHILANGPDVLAQTLRAPVAFTNQSGPFWSEMPWPGLRHASPV